MLLFDAQLHLLAHRRLEHVLLVARHRLPVRDLGRVDGFAALPCGEHNGRHRVLGEVGCRAGDGSDAGGEDGVVEITVPGYLPYLLGSEAANFFEDGGRGGTGGDHDVVAQKFGFRFVMRDVEEGKEVVGVRLGKEVAEEIYRSFDEHARRACMEIVFVQHALNLHGFDLGVERAGSFADVDDFANEVFAGH